MESMKQTPNEEMMFEIGYYIGRSNVLSLAFPSLIKITEINYSSLKYAHECWRVFRNYDKVGEEK